VAQGGSPGAARDLARVLALVLLLGGCATAYGEGVSAYRQGRYAEAAERFEAIVAEHPERVEALVGLGVSRYRLGDWNGAAAALGDAAALQPAHPGARLYLGLAHLQRGDAPLAAEALGAYRSLLPGTRVAGLVDHAVRLLPSASLSPEERAFVASSLEAAAAWQEEVVFLREALRLEEFRRLTDERVIYVPRRCRC